MKNSINICLIVCGGMGVRVNSNVPKQYIKIDGKTILYKSISIFLEHPDIDYVAVAVNKSYRKLYYETVEDFPSFNEKLLLPVCGGELRQDSVRKGLKYIKSFSPDKVLIHDAVRPFVSIPLITNVLDNIKPGQAVLPVLPSFDTIKQCKDGYVEKTLDRNFLYAAQTPQGFIFEEILDLHLKHKYNKKITDDVSLFEISNKKVLCVEGHKKNIKITTNEDLVI